MKFVAAVFFYNFLAWLSKLIFSFAAVPLGTCILWILLDFLNFPRPEVQPWTQYFGTLQHF